MHSVTALTDIRQGSRDDADPEVRAAHLRRLLLRVQMEQQRRYMQQVGDAAGGSESGMTSGMVHAPPGSQAVQEEEVAVRRGGLAWRLADDAGQ